MPVDKDEWNYTVPALSEHTANIREMIVAANPEYIELLEEISTRKEIAAEVYHE
ncbi:hypothetical protein [Effusibacillus lacus]|uniref:hypothetical protein n=1 Tax=Effusibacillus lacus TaxID=1348429 RepID=UPI0010CF7F56|nr:hypothetical protein [Effusibacillus lacus]TCS69496.1 hypothetical protein EDD64_13612 [Effusibacillus lacus]